MRLSQDQKYMLGFGVLALLAVFVFWAVTRFDSAKNVTLVDDPQIVSLRECIARNLADPDAELTDVSDIVVWKDQRWREVQIRHVNTVGGRVFTLFLATFHGDECRELVARKAMVEAYYGAGDRDELDPFLKALDSMKLHDVRKEKTGQ